MAAACSSDPKIYGPSYDGGPDADAQNDVTQNDVGQNDVVTSDVATDAPTCTSQIAFIGGNGTSAFGAGGPPSNIASATIPATLLDCPKPVAIVRSGSGLLAAIAEADGTLASTPYQTSWADPAAVASAKTIDSPALAAGSQTAHLVYQAADYKYYHAQYTQSAWDSATDPVGGSGSSQSFGARSPGAATAGSDLVIVQAGSDSYLYDQTWNVSWQAAHKQGSAGVQQTISPTMIALSGGASDLLATYMRNADYKVMAVARSAGTWTASPMQIDVNAYSNDPAVLAPLPAGKALLVFRGSDQKPYFSTWDGATTWTAPAAVVTNANPIVLSTPSIAPGVCGADAVVAWAESGGGVKWANFSGGTFGSPQSLAGTSGSTFVAVATLP
jgi:hypothetical protein